MRYPLAGRQRLAGLTTGGGLAAAALGVVRAAAVRAPGPLALPLALGGGLIWLGRNLGDAFVEVSDDRVRVRLGALFDQTIPLSEIADVREARWSWLGGLGVRTNLRDMVAVVTAAGRVGELSLRQARRLPVIPRVYHVRARRLIVSPKNLDLFLSDLRARLG